MSVGSRAVLKLHQCAGDYRNDSGYVKGPGVGSGTGTGGQGGISSHIPGTEANRERNYESGQGYGESCELCCVC